MMLIATISHCLFLHAEVPSAPGISSINYTSVSVYLSWTVPTFIGNSAVLGYKVYQRAVDSNTTLQQLPGVGGQYTTTSTMINIMTGISPYTKYEFAVEACNIIGCSSDRLMYSPFRTSSASEYYIFLLCLVQFLSCTQLQDLLHITVKLWLSPQPRSEPHGLLHPFQTD